MKAKCETCHGDYDLPATIKCTECNMNVCETCYEFCDCLKKTTVTDEELEIAIKECSRVFGVKTANDYINGNEY